MANLNQNIKELDNSDSYAFMLEEASNKNIKAYIPKFMCNIDMKDKVWNKNISLDTSCIKNSNVKVNKLVNTRNFIYLSPLNTTGEDIITPEKGEKLKVSFIDGDLNKGQYIPSLFLNNRKNIYHRWYVENNYEIKKPTTNSERCNERLKKLSNKEYPIIKSKEIKLTRRNPSDSSFISSDSNSDTYYNKVQSSLAKDDRITKKEENAKSYFDIIMDSNNHILGFRVLNEDNEEIMCIKINSENQNIEISNSSSSIKLNGKDLDINLTNGRVSLNNSISNLILDDDYIELNNGKSKITIDDDIKISKDNKSYSLFDLFERSDNN